MFLVTVKFVTVDLIFHNIRHRNDADNSMMIVVDSVSMDSRFSTVNDEYSLASAQKDIILDNWRVDTLPSSKSNICFDILWDSVSFDMSAGGFNNQNTLIHNNVSLR